MSGINFEQSKLYFENGGAIYLINL
jgi:hypothetical protein